jgi:hypothetical protein
LRRCFSGRQSLSCFRGAKRPVDLFLYELRPLRKQREVLKALKSMDVKFEISGMRGAPLKKEAIWSGSH